MYEELYDLLDKLLKGDLITKEKCLEAQHIEWNEF